MLTAAFVDPIADPGWSEFVATSPSAEAFHHPRWLELLQSQYGYELRGCCVRDGDAILAAIPVARISSRLTGNRLVSVPFSDTCAAALAPGAGPEALSALGREMAAEARRTGLELTVHGALPSLPGAFVQQRFHRHLLPLGADPEAALRQAAQGHGRKVRRARREGLRGERRTDAAALDAFYALHLSTRRRLGVPTQPKAFIARFTELFEAGLGFVWVVRDGDRPVAAAVFLTHNGTLTYKYGASDAAALGKRPNDLLFFELIHWACEAGFETLDFGRTDSDNEGLRRFKRSWGAEELPLSYTYLTDREPAPPHPPRMRRRLATATIRRSPALLGRIAGEVLYRHAG